MAKPRPILPPHPAAVTSASASEPAAAPPPPAASPAPPAAPADHAAVDNASTAHFTPVPVEDVDVVSTSSGIRCPACGRDMVPRIHRTRPEKLQREGDCTLCGRTIVITYRPDGRPLTARRK